MRNRMRCAGWVVLTGMAACAGMTADEKRVDLSGYTKIVVPPVTTSVTGEKRGESEHFAAVLRGALTRQIDSGGKLDPLAYPGKDLQGTARLQVDVEDLDREDKSWDCRVRYTVVDAATNAVIFPGSESWSSGGTNGGDRFDGLNSLPWVAERTADNICEALGLAQPPPGSEVE